MTGTKGVREQGEVAKWEEASPMGNRALNESWS